VPCTATLQLYRERWLLFGKFIVMVCGLFGKEVEMGEIVACMEVKKNTELWGNLK